MKTGGVKTVAIYLGSSAGAGDKYMAFAGQVGRTLAGHGIGVVYGGACVGTMGALAAGVLEAGGHVTGVFPEGFGGKREVRDAHIEILAKDLTECIIVRDFAQRKEVMERLSDCALVLPGGVGTMDELFTFGVDNEIGRHDKEVYVLNLDGYYDGLQAQMKVFVREGFLREYHIDHPGGIIRFCRSIEEFLEMTGCDGPKGRAE